MFKEYASFSIQKMLEFYERNSNLINFKLHYSFISFCVYYYFLLLLIIFFSEEELNKYVKRIFFSKTRPDVAKSQ